MSCSCCWAPDDIEVYVILLCHIDVGDVGIDVGDVGSLLPRKVRFPFAPTECA